MTAWELVVSARHALASAELLAGHTISDEELR